MHVSRPTWENKWNLTTVVALVMFAATAGGWFYTSGQFTSSVAEMGRKYDVWISNHEQLHKDRNIEVSSNSARADQRIVALESGVSKIENLTYRLTVQEQGSANLSRSVEELKATVNNQSADIRVMLEILKRLDPTVAR